MTDPIMGHKRKRVEKSLPFYVPGGELLPSGSHSELSCEKLWIHKLRPYPQIPHTSRKISLKSSLVLTLYPTSFSMKGNEHR